MRSFFVAIALTKLVTTLPTAEPETSENVTVYKRAPPMSFNCADLPDICTSMCWGAYCTEPTFGVTLNFDNPTESTKSARRTSAGCQPRPNRCSVNHNPPFPQTGYNCDEYPFASTSDADKGGQTNRCVPKTQNSAQGAIIKNYISSSCGCQPCQFIVGFGNPAAANVKYCSAFNDRPNQCIPDDNTYKGQNPDVQPPAKRDLSSTGLSVKPRGGLYMTRSGTTISFGEDMEPGTLIKHAVPRRDTIEARAMVAAKVQLENRQDCDPGDGDEWDDGNDAATRRKRGLGARMSAADPASLPDFEFVDDFIAYKL